MANGATRTNVRSVSKLEGTPVEGMALGPAIHPWYSEAWHRMNERAQKFIRRLNEPTCRVVLYVPFTVELRFPLMVRFS